VIPAVFVCFLFMISCASLYFNSLEPPEGTYRIRTIENLPYREIWKGFVFNGEKVGFTHMKISPIPGSDNFLIASQAHLRFLFLGMDKHIALKREDTVRSDLTLISFHYEQQMDKEPLRIDGDIVDGTFRFIQESNGRKKTVEKELNDALYPLSVINLYPVIKGMTIGSKYRYKVFDPQTQAIAPVTQSVTAFETSKEMDVEPSFKVETTLLGHGVSTWINLHGKAIFEIGMGGVLITYKEDEDRARNYLLEAGLNKKDLILDFSCVKTGTTLPCPRETTFLEISLEGVSGVLPILQGPGQEAFVNRNGDADSAMYRITSDAVSLPRARGGVLTKKEHYLYLAPTMHLESNDPEIKKTAADVTSTARTPLEQVRKLTHWVSESIRDEAVDSTSAVDVLHDRRGECQAHSMLYTAMARALGIPTKLAGGLVYMEGIGFLFHNWAESYIDGWIAVDPTFNQVGIDATHIKLVESPFWISILDLGKVVGKIKAEIIDYQATCGDEANH
ncbi:MAG: transglutaminase domain-containing protein, partial [Deltaproteobacteria bacterium]|nr:transglutaminase domain-containing protein [Deltaproteobacteria bacterium]